MLLCTAQSPGHLLFSFLRVSTGSAIIYNSDIIGNHTSQLVKAISSAHILVVRLNEVTVFISEQSALLIILFLHCPEIDYCVEVKRTKG